MQVAQSERSVKPLQIASKVRILLCPFRRGKMGDISVIIPVYNGAKTIERALAALIRTQSQILWDRGLRTAIRCLLFCLCSSTGRTIDL